MLKVDVNNLHNVISYVTDTIVSSLNGISFDDLVRDLEIDDLVSYLIKSNKNIKFFSDKYPGIFEVYIDYLKAYKQCKYPDLNMLGRLIDCSGKYYSTINTINIDKYIIMECVFNLMEEAYKNYNEDFIDEKTKAIILNNYYIVNTRDGFHSFPHTIGISKRPFNESLATKTNISPGTLEPFEIMSFIFEHRCDIIARDIELLDQGEETILPYDKIILKLYMLRKMGILPRPAAYYQINDNSFPSLYDRTIDSMSICFENEKKNNGNYIFEGRTTNEFNRHPLITRRFVTKNKIIPFENFQRPISNIEYYRKCFEGKEPYFVIGYLDANNNKQYFEEKRVRSFIREFSRDKWFKDSSNSRK